MEFLTRQAKVLLWVALHPDATIVEIADKAEISRRAVQMSLRSLEAEGHVERHRVGRRNTYRIAPEHKLDPTHPDAYLTVQDLVAMIKPGHPWYPSEDGRAGGGGPDPER